MLYTPTNGKVSSPFGYRWSGTDWHGGIDFAAPVGTPVYAANSGTVVNVWPDGAMSKYGQTIVLKHDQPAEAAYSLYAHLSAANVTRGQHVTKGQRIGSVGTTAASKENPNRKVGAHLHFELLSKWPPPAPDTYRVNPTPYLDPKVFPPGMVKPVSISLGTLLVLGGGAYWWWKNRRRFS